MSTRGSVRTMRAPAGPVRSPSSTIVSSMRTPSETAVPVCRPAARKMRVIIRVVVDFPFVPVMLTVGTRRSGSRIHVGGSVAAVAMRSTARAITPLVIPIRSPRTWVESGDREPDRGVGDGLGPTALLPRERDDPVPRLGAAMDRRLWRRRRVADPGDVVQSADPRRDVAHRRWCRLQRNAATEPDDRVAARRSDAVPGASAADDDLDLHRRLQAIEVRAIKQPDLDEPHGGEDTGPSGRAKRPSSQSP